VRRHSFFWSTGDAVLKRTRNNKRILGLKYSVVCIINKVKSFNIIILTMRYVRLFIDNNSIEYDMDNMSLLLLT